MWRLLITRISVALNLSNSCSATSRYIAKSATQNFFVKTWGKRPFPQPITTKNNITIYALPFPICNMSTASKLVAKDGSIVTSDDVVKLKNEVEVVDHESRPGEVQHDDVKLTDDNVEEGPAEDTTQDAIVTDVAAASHGRKSRKRKGPKLHMTFKRPRITSNETMSQTKYYFENGLRKVYPYDHKFNTFCKGRWVDKTLREIYTSEFRFYGVDFYQKAMEDGRLLVNLKRPTSLDQVLQDNDLLSSTVHRHECPVTDARIEVVEDNDDFFVINKPGSIPLHPGGRFRHNTVLSILAKEMRKTNLLSVHRLDRLTSGLLVFVKNKKIATKVHSHIRERKVQKEYVCRVVGNFSKFKLDTAGGHRVTVGEGDCPEVTVNEPMKVYDYKIGTSVVSRDDGAKECETVFKCLFSDGKTSVVSCMPKTGRTHQIRVHLQYLGYPITNDPIYNSPAWGEDRFKLGPITKPLDQVMKEIISMKKWLAAMENTTEGTSDKDTEPVESEAATNSVKIDDSTPEVVHRKGDIIIYRSSCEECRNPLSDPKPCELIMYLHALKYKGPDWEFETPLPMWALPDWVDETIEET